MQSASLYSTIPHHDLVAVQVFEDTLQKFPAHDVAHQKLDWTSRREDRATKKTFCSHPRVDPFEYLLQKHFQHGMPLFHRSQLLAQSLIHQSQRSNPSESLAQPRST